MPELDDLRGRDFYNRAMKHWDAGRFDLAAPEFAEAEKYFHEAYGSNHLWTIDAGVQWASCMFRLGNTESAVRALEGYFHREVDAHGEDSDYAKTLKRYLVAWQGSLASEEHAVVDETRLIPSPHQPSPLMLDYRDGHESVPGSDLVELPSPAQGKVDADSVWTLRGVAIEAAIAQWVRKHMSGSET